MKAIDVMTSPVISVTPDTPVREIAALLFERRISGLPVVENGRLVGMVSEADLLHRHEIGTECIGREGSWWLRLFTHDRSIEDYIKSHAVKARDIMSREALATTAAEAASAKSDAAIRRRLLDELHGQSWWRDAPSNVVVEDGVVHYWGLIYEDQERQAARVAAESVAGVRSVQDHRLAYRDLPQWL